MRSYLQSPVLSRRGHSELEVIASPEGFYIGTMKYQKGVGTPALRESDHYPTRTAAEDELKRRALMSPDAYRVELYSWAVKTDNLFIRVALEGSLSREMQAFLGADEMNCRWKTIIDSPDPAPLFAQAVKDVQQAKAEGEAERWEQAMDAIAEDRRHHQQSRLEAIEAQQDAEGLGRTPELTPGPKR